MEASRWAFRVSAALITEPRTESLIMSHGNDQIQNPKSPDNSPIKPETPTRGSSLQGPGQSAKGGPAGANQGGAPRGGSRVEPSHQQRAQKQDRQGR